jgi:hypothetical protein
MKIILETHRTRPNLHLISTSLLANLFRQFPTPQNSLNYLAFQFFNFERHLMKIIPETRRVH